VAHLQSTLSKDRVLAEGLFACTQAFRHTHTHGLQAQSYFAGLEGVKCWRTLVNKLLPALLRVSVLAAGHSWEAQPCPAPGSPATPRQGRRDGDGRDQPPPWETLRGRWAGVPGQNWFGRATIKG